MLLPQIPDFSITLGSAVKWSHIIGAIGTLILYIFLIIANWKIIGVNKGQNELLKAEHRTSLQITQDNMIDDDLRLSISNFGNGTAKDIELQTSVLFIYDDEDSGKNEDEIYNAKSDLKRYEEDTITNDRAILSGERDKIFRATVPFPTPNGNEHTFSKGVRKAITEEGVSQIRFQLFVVHKDMLEETYSNKVSYTREFSYSDEEFPISYRRLVSICPSKAEPISYDSTTEGSKLWSLGK